MKIKKLKTATLAEALKEMRIGETAIAPDGYSPATVMKTCSELKLKGFLFSTSRSGDIQKITRHK